MRRFLQNRTLHLFGHLERIVKNFWPRAIRKFLISNNLAMEDQENSGVS